MPEKEIQNSILLTFGRMPEMRLWRVNVGMGYGYYIIQKAVQILKNAGIKAFLKHFKTISPIRYGQKGAADIQGIIKGGRFLAIEVKTATGRQSPEQKSWQKMIEMYGGIYILARSIEDVQTRLQLEGVI